MHDSEIDTESASELRRKVQQLQERVAELEGELHENGHNSEELQGSLAMLCENDGKQNPFFEANPLMVACVDSNERYRAINSNYSVFFGISQNDAVGKHIREVLGENVYSRLKVKIEAALNNSMVDYEEQITDKDGAIHFLHGWIVPYHAHNSPHDGFAVFVENITKGKKLEQEQDDLQQQLVQSHRLEAMGHLAGGVAHDFNNLLSVILGYAEMSLMELEPCEEMYNRLKYIVKVAEKSKGITRQLLAFTRSQNQAPQVLDLNESVESMLKMLCRLIGEDVDLTLNPGSALWPIKMDPSNLDQILVNLCINAKDAIAGVGKITIETKNLILDDTLCAEFGEFEPGEYVVLSVRDNGSGMDNETLGKIFEPFYTTKPSNQGTGMGLSIIHSIIKQRNGFIKTRSEVGVGTTFDIYIPRNQGEVDERGIDKTPNPNPQMHDETVMIVEDEVDLLKLLKAMLERMGYNVLEAASPSQAMSLVKNHTGKIQLLISDVVMPEMNGRDLANRMQALRPELKVLFMSGYRSDRVAHCGVAEQNENYIAKPFNLENMSNKIREALNSN